MDSLGYHYYPGTNRLNHVTDQVAAATFGNGQNDVADIDNQNAGNYHYDETGNLVKDLAEGIDKITWTVYRKIASIEKANGTNIFYTYDPSGNRISKLVQRSSGDNNYTWYVRDAQGNVMATYTANGQEEELANLNLKLSERHLYGSSRLGILTEEIDVDNNNTGPVEVEEIKLISYYRGYCQYELSNHLGNVLATVSDKKFGIDNNDDEEIDYFEPEIITASDYYPFGMLMPGRGGSLINGEWKENGPEVLANLSVYDRTGNQPDEYIALESIEFLPGFESGSSDEFVAYITTSVTSGSEGEEGLYRYGFNGKENDNHFSGNGNKLDFGARINDSRIARWLSLDPLQKKYPNESHYAFVSNSPVLYADKDGMDKIVVTTIIGKDGKITQIRSIDKNYFEYRHNWRQGIGNVTKSDIEHFYIIDLRKEGAGRISHTSRLTNSNNISVYEYSIFSDMVNSFFGTKDQSHKVQYGYRIFGKGKDMEWQNGLPTAAEGSETLDLGGWLDFTSGLRNGMSTRDFAEDYLKNEAFLKLIQKIDQLAEGAEKIKNYKNHQESNKSKSIYYRLDDYGTEKRGSIQDHKYLGDKIIRRNKDTIFVVQEKPTD